MYARIFWNSRRVAHPVVKGFVLPEWRAGTFENEVGLPRRRAFNLPRDLTEWRERREQYMNVIGHDCIGTQGE